MKPPEILNEPSDPAIRQFIDRLYEVTTKPQPFDSETDEGVSCDADPEQWSDVVRAALVVVPLPRVTIVAVVESLRDLGWRTPTVRRALAMAGALRLHGEHALDALGYGAQWADPLSPDLSGRSAELASHVCSTGELYRTLSLMRCALEDEAQAGDEAVMVSYVMPRPPCVEDGMF